MRLHDEFTLKATSAGWPDSGPKVLVDAQQTRSMPKFLKAADLHVHTYYSEDVLPAPSNDPIRLYAEARRRGLQFISFTDHETMDAYDRVGWQREGLVPGVELSILDRRNVGHTIHVNVYTLNQGQFRTLRELASRKRDLETFLSFLASERLPHTYNHPFWFERGEKPNIRAVLDVAKIFPVIEYNRGRTRSLNRLALALADHYGKGIVANSDSHTGRTLGLVRTYAAGETFEEYFDNVRTGKSWILAQDMTIRGLVEEANEWIRQFFARHPSRANPEAVPSELGPKPLGWLLGLRRRDGLLGDNLLWRTLERCLYALSNSAVIQSLYVRSQEMLALRVLKQLPILLAPYSLARDATFLL